ncbi:hypothetical protein J7L60_01570, partial [Candidatus Bathyarchaeota archaeon]|nr:hypothetical protein [Candidatus Bathyarchaeota archaeon]
MSKAIPRITNTADTTNNGKISGIKAVNPEKRPKNRIKRPLIFRAVLHIDGSPFSAIVDAPMVIPWIRHQAAAINEAPIRIDVGIKDMA